MSTTTTTQPAYFSTGEVWEAPTGNRYLASGVTNDLVRLEPIGPSGESHWWNRNRVGRWVRISAAGEG